MKLCLDTDAYTKLFQTGSDALQQLLEEAETILVPSVVLGELAAGFEMGSKREKNFRLLNEFLDVSGTETATVNRDVAERYGLLVKVLRQNGTPIPTNDIWIAATALETGARLVTYDAHFDVVPGLYVLAP